MNYAYETHIWHVSLKLKASAGAELFPVICFPQNHNNVCS